MNKKRILQSVCALLLAAVCCWSGLGPRALAAGQATRVVRVPCGINDLLRLDEMGGPVGSYAAYLDKLARVNDWQYEYVETTWTHAVKMLEAGELDLLFPTNYTDERTETMDFSAMVAGYTAPALFAWEDSDYGYEDFANFDGARIGVTQGSSNEQALIEYSQSKGFAYTPVYIESNTEKARVLAEGGVDMIIMSSNTDLSGAVLVSVMQANPFYLTVKKGDGELLAEIDEGMQKILREDPELVADALSQCLMGEKGSVLAFTREEKAFINSAQPVVVGFYEDTRPLAYVDRDGSCKGVYVELLNSVREKAGINLVLQPIDRDNNWQDLVNAGELDFFLGVSSSLAGEDPNFISTDVFFPYDNVLVTRSNCAFNELESPVIALTNGRTYLDGYVSTSLGAGEIRFYRSAKDCLIAVLNGEADGTVLNNVEYHYQSKNARFADLIQWENYRVTTAGGLMAAADVDPVMFSTVNKAVGVLSNDFVSTTISDKLNMPYDATLEDNLYIFRYLLVAVGIVGLTAVVVGVIIGRTRRRQKDVMARVQEHERHQLRILAALSRNYDAIYYVDLDADTCEEIQANDHAVEGAGRVTPVSNLYWETMRQYVERYVQPEYYEMLRPLSDPKTILQRFQESADFTVRYQVKPNEQGQEYFELHMVDVSEEGKEHAMVFGTRCIDGVVRAETDQRQLLQNALEAANKASSAKSDFLSKMSHDIRTPMNAIIGMTAIATAHLDDTERVKDSLDKIDTSSRYLLGLINDVLDMSKIESGDIALHEEAFNLSDLLDNLLIMVQPQIKQHNHSLEVHIQDIQHEDVLGDSLRIQQAFVNIMGNAVKYTPDGGKLSLAVRELPSGSPKLAGYEFTFRDNGIGMSKEYIQRIFEPFSRAEDVRVSKIQGTGLGMAITQNIVRQMDGSIQIESEEGKGSTFTVTIYLKLQEALKQEQKEPESAKDQLHDIQDSDYTGYRALLVEDNELNREIAREIMEMAGLQVEDAENGKIAVDKVMASERGYYNIIFMDIQMPVMSGYDAAMAIRSLDRSDLLSVPIIAMTANAFVEDVQASKAAGMNEHLAKPIDFDKFTAILKKYLG